MSLATDADALALVRHGSGWATINDTSDVRREVTSARSMLAQLADEIALRVTRGELETFLRLVEEGVYIGKAGSMYRVFIDDSGVHIQQYGVDIATFAKRTLITPYVLSLIHISGSRITGGNSFCACAPSAATTPFCAPCACAPAAIPAARRVWPAAARACHTSPRRRKGCLLYTSRCV